MITKGTIQGVEVEATGRITVVMLTTGGDVVRCPLAKDIIEGHGSPGDYQVGAEVELWETRTTQGWVVVKPRVGLGR